MHLAVCSYHVTYVFQSESTFYICLNVKKVLARNRGNIWSLSDCNGTRTLNHLVHQQTLNHLANLTKWLRWFESPYWYGAFDFMFFLCHVHVWDWIHTLYFSESQGTPCSKQVQYLKFKWLQRDSNPHVLSSWTNTKPFGKTD